MEITLAPEEMEGLDEAGLKALYEQKVSVPRAEGGTRLPRVHSFSTRMGGSGMPCMCAPLLHLHARAAHAPLALQVWRCHGSTIPTYPLPATSITYLHILHSHSCTCTCTCTYPLLPLADVRKMVPQCPPVHHLPAHPHPLLAPALALTAPLLLQLAEVRTAGGKREDFSDMVAAKAAQQKRKAAQKAGGEKKQKTGKDFKF